MAQMPDESVQMVCTSPPYLGLRDYGIAPSVWGGEAHEHEWGAAIVANAAGYEAGEKARWNHRQNGRGEVQDRILEKGAGWTRRDVGQGSFCLCGAWLGVLGLEPTVELYVAHMVEVFREVRRVLRKDGTAWLNLGDSYCAKGSGFSGPNRLPQPGLKPKDRMMVPARVALALQADGWWLRDEIVWHKNNPMPSSVTDRTTPAHEMVYLLTRSARYSIDMAAISEPATYSGPNGAQLSPYGQGFTRRSAALSFDRATKEADVPGQSVRQHRVGRDAKQAQIAANSCPSTERTMGGFNDRWDASEDAGVAPLTRNKRSVWTIPIAPYSGYSQSVRWGDVEADAVGGDIQRTESPDCPVHVGLPVPAAIPSDGGRGIASPSSFRSLGMFDGPAPEPQGAPGSTGLRHAPDSVGESSGSTLLPCVPAAIDRSNGSRRTDPDPATSPPCTPFAETSGRTDDTRAEPGSAGWADRTSENSSESADPADHSAQTASRTSDTLSCTCSYQRRTTESISHFATFPPKLVEPMILAGSKPGDVILDPFGGSGTVGQVAQMHSRRAVLIDLNPDYLAQQMQRCAQSPLGLESVS